MTVGQRMGSVHMDSWCAVVSVPVATLTESRGRSTQPMCGVIITQVKSGLIHFFIETSNKIVTYLLDFSIYIKERPVVNLREVTTGAGWRSYATCACCRRRLMKTTRPNSPVPVRTSDAGSGTGGGTT